MTSMLTIAEILLALEIKTYNNTSSVIKFKFVKLESLSS